jgi:hypothetical protein
MYRLTVEGELGDSLASALDGAILERSAGTTTLLAYARDQAELHALLRRVADFGLTLLQATTADDDLG